MPRVRLIESTRPALVGRALLVLPARFARERPAPLQAALPMRPESKVRHDTPPREPVRRVFAPGSSGGGGPLVPRLLVGLPEDNAC